MVEAKLANRGREETDAAQRQAQIKRLNEFIQRFRAGSPLLAGEIPGAPSGETHAPRA